jgi:choloylglycine hydrolase
MCTRIFWNTNGVAKTVSRCLDWAVNDEPDLWFFPRGTEHAGDAGGGPGLDDIDGTGTERVANTLTWRSRYASVGVTMWRLGTIDGLNERGLAAHTLYLDPEEAEFEPADDRPAVAHIQWAQYLLDNFATVAEVIEALDEVRIAAPLIRGQHMGAHMAIEDPTGDSAIIEPIGGRLVVHHGAEFSVMSNSPSLDQQLANRARYRPFGGDETPPGDISSLDRFVRASYFLHYLPEPENVEQAVAGVFQLIENVSVPYGAPYTDGSVYPTWWHSAADVTNRVYYFESTRSPSAFWVDLAALADGDEVLRLDPRDVALVGDETARLRASTAAVWPAA